MPNSACVVDNDSFRCVCNPGYQQFYIDNSTVCADINECQSGLHDCDINAQCINQVGTYYCKCNPGFTGDGQVCENAFSCHNVACPPNAECIESNRVAMCRCMPGFTGDGQICSPVLDHSCHTANNCAQFGICTIDKDTNRYYCACLPGYEGDGYSCRKIENSTRQETETRETQRCLMGVCWCPEGYKIEQGSTFCIAEDRTTTETSTNEGVYICL